ncbi:flagellar hook-basal body complex protein, partial [Shewanella sp. 0m-11]
PAVIKTEALGVGGADVLGAGADGSQTLTLNFNNPTQYASPFEVTELTQDGTTVGRLTNVEVGADGLINASYSNGSTVPLARVALVSFANEQGLTQAGNTSWKASLDSGPALAGEANSGTFGSVRSSALEQSNVDLTTELVDLISAQRNFQANSRTLEVNNTLQQTVLQIR